MAGAGASILTASLYVAVDTLASAFCTKDHRPESGDRQEKVFNFLCNWDMLSRDGVPAGDRVT